MKKVVGIILVIFAISSIVSPPLIRAWAPLTTGEAGDSYDKEGQLSIPVHVEETLKNIFALIAGAGGATQFVTADAALQKQYAQQSIYGRVGQGIALMYQEKPANMGTYFADLKSRVGFPISTAYAQGIGVGYGGLSPLLTVWRAFRNIAYGFIIIVMVIIGFMMLFRMKIDPRTVITVQNALPRIVITLILITFSYAIVAATIDFSYLVINIVLLSLAKADPTIFQHFTGGALTHLMGTTFTTGLSAIDDLINFLGLGFDSNIVVKVISGLVGGALALFTPIRILGGVPLIAGVSAFALPTVILGAIVIIALIFLMFRIFFMLLTAWIQVFISLIFGPIQLMFGAIPGVNTFGSWFKNLFANVMVFPITAILLFIATYLGTRPGTDLDTLWKPPGLGGGSTQGVAGFIGLGMLIIIPNLVNGFKQALKVQSVLPIGPGTFAGGAFTGLGALWNLVYQGTILRSTLRRGAPAITQQAASQTPRPTPKAPPLPFDEIK